MLSSGNTGALVAPVSIGASKMKTVNFWLLVTCKTITAIWANAFKRK